MNDVYSAACETSECFLKQDTLTYTAGAEEVSLASECSGLIKALSVHLDDYSGYGTLKLDPIDRVGWLREKDRSNSTEGIPRFYNLYYKSGVLYLSLYPTPDTAATVAVEYVSTPPTLVASGAGAGEETTPSAFPARYHYSIISNGAIAMAHEHDGKLDKADRFWQRYDVAVERLSAVMNELNGNEQMIAHFRESSRLGSTDRSRDF